MRGEQDLLAFSFRDHAERPVTEVTHTTPCQERVRPVPVLCAVMVPPGLECTMETAHHDLTSRDVGAQLADHRPADQRDARSELPEVDSAQTSPEDLDRARGRPESAGCHLEKGGLSRPVRAEDDPSIALTDGPVDVGQHGHAITPHCDVPQPDDR